MNCTPACKACAEESRAQARIDALDDLSHGGKLKQELDGLRAELTSAVDKLERPTPRWRVGVADSTGLIPIVDENGRACAFVPALYMDAGKVAERIASVPALVRKLEAVRKHLAQLTDTSSGWPKAVREAAQQVLDDHLTGDL